jgi:hypothetical protein
VDSFAGVVKMSFLTIEVLVLLDLRISPSAREMSRRASVRGLLLHCCFIFFVLYIYLALCTSTHASFRCGMVTCVSCAPPDGIVVFFLRLILRLKCRLKFPELKNLAPFH